MLDVETYTQMGYTEAQVRKAYELTQKSKIDMFDALQQLQNKEYAEKDKKSHINLPSYSYLMPLKNMKLSEYEVIYSRNGVKHMHFGRDQLRQANTPVGLLNVSNCCYLNSLLQCYFLMGAFTKQILMAEAVDELPEQPGVRNKRINNQYKLLGALKQIFAKMKLSSRKYLDPTPVLRNLVNSLGEKIQFGDEKDLNEINMEIVERLSECLMFTKKYFSKGDGSPSKSKKRESLKHLFYGEKVEFLEDIQDNFCTDFMGIILNPKYGNLISALDAEFNFDVQVNGKIKKKHTYIRTLPTYLFFTINRTEFVKKANQVLKNSEKLSFDFVIYLDSYLQKNKQESQQKKSKVRQLQQRRNSLKKQLEHLNILAQKLKQCEEHASFLSGWQKKIPKQSQVREEQTKIRQKISDIEQQLEQIQSRDEKYVLMYLFVHRGDAISGHYWGYGRNGNHWYRFDVNCSSIKESSILVDMQKSGGIPYALVYAKEEVLQSFAYPYYADETIAGTDLLGLDAEKEDYLQFVPTQIKNSIISQNIAMHKSIEKQNIRNIIQNLLIDYKGKFNIVKSESEKYKKSNPQSKIPLYSNFACFLETIDQAEFMKYNIFSVSLFAKTEMSCTELLQEQKLLKSIQKAFKKKVKGRLALKHFAIQCEPIEGVLYKEKIQEYLVGKKCLQFLRLLHNSIKNWPKIQNLSTIIDDAVQAFQVPLKNGVYLKNVCREILSLILIDLAIKQESIQTNWVNACNEQNALLRQQLSKLNAKYKSQSKNQVSSIGEIQLELQWSLDSLKKGFQYDVMKGIREILAGLGEGLKVYKINVKEKLIYTKDGNVEPENQSQQTVQDLI